MTDDPFMQPESGPVFGEVNSRGKYALPHPITGEPAEWQRTTNFIKKLDDTYALHKWDKRKVIEGLALDEGLYAEACSLALVPEGEELDTKALDKLAEAAHDRAGGNTGRRIGSALHRFTERQSRGLPSGAPERWQRHVERYAETLREYRLTIVPELIERTVVNLTYGCAGKFDNGLRDVFGRIILGDLKSKRKIHGYGSEALQFAMYVNADAMWDPVAGKYEDMPAFDKDTALMIWLPASGDVCEIHGVDIAEGWRALKLCDQVREWQNLAKRKNGIGAQAAPPSAMAVTEAYAKRILEAGTREELSAIWREAEGFGVWSLELDDLGAERLKFLHTAGLTA